jgi:hypothetical protein
MKLELVKQTGNAVKHTGNASRAQQADKAAAAAAAGRRGLKQAAATVPGEEQGAAGAGHDAAEEAAGAALPAAADQEALQAALEQDIGSVVQLYSSLASSNCAVPAEQIFDVSRQLIDTPPGLLLPSPCPSGHAEVDQPSCRASCAASQPRALLMTSPASTACSAGQPPRRPAGDQGGHHARPGASCSARHLRGLPAEVGGRVLPLGGCGGKGAPVPTFAAPLVRRPLPP